MIEGIELTANVGDPHAFSVEPRTRVECQTWCVYGNGHPNEHAIIDQVCFGEEHRLPLSLHDPIEGDDADYLTVYLAQGPVEPLSFMLGHNEQPALRLTPQEAMQLVENLVDAFGFVPANHPAHDCENSRQRGFDSGWAACAQLTAHPSQRRRGWFGRGRSAA